jgi:hypothetical protein
MYFSVSDLGELLSIIVIEFSIKITVHACILLVESTVELI